jgi:hypothetical protein
MFNVLDCTYLVRYLLSFEGAGEGCRWPPRVAATAIKGRGGVEATPNVHCHSLKSVSKRAPTLKNNPCILTIHRVSCILLYQIEVKEIEDAVIRGSDS